MSTPCSRRATRRAAAELTAHRRRLLERSETGEARPQRTRERPSEIAGHDEREGAGAEYAGGIDCDPSDAILLRVPPTAPDLTTAALTRLLADLPPARRPSTTTPLRPIDFPRPPLITRRPATT